MNTQEIKSVLKPLVSKEKLGRFAKEISKSSHDTTRVCYNTIGHLLSRKKPEDILNNLENNKVNWEDPCFDGIRYKIQEHDDYLVTPFDVEDGVVDCPKCESKKTYSWQKQCRGGDESMTTFSHCAVCRYFWTYSG